MHASYPGVGVAICPCLQLPPVLHIEGAILLHLPSLHTPVGYWDDNDDGDNDNTDEDGGGCCDEDESEDDYDCD